MKDPICPKCRQQIMKEWQSCPVCGAALNQSGSGVTGTDWKSQTQFFGIPLIHIAFGKDENGKRRIARGIIAIGQFGIGVITIAQFGVGIIGFGQLMIAGAALAQIAITAFFGVGQLAVGFIAIGQLASGWYCLGQIGIGRFVLDNSHHDPAALDFFTALLSKIGIAL